MTNVRIGFAVNDLSATAVPAFIRELQPILTAPVGASWQLNLDIGGSGYLGPTAAAVVASSLLLAKTDQQVAEVNLPQAPPALAAFCTFSGLTFLVENGHLAPPLAADAPESETAPLQQFRKMHWGGSTPLVRLIRRHLPGLGSDSEDLLRTCYSEIVQNIEDHSGSPIGGVICARYFAKLHEIRIAVADRGQGIGEHLRRSAATSKIAIRDDAHALDLVLRGGVTSKSRSGSRTRLNAASAFPGTLVLLSLRVSAGDSELDGE